MFCFDRAAFFVYMVGVIGPSLLPMYFLIPLVHRIIALKDEYNGLFFVGDCCSNDYLPPTDVFIILIISDSGLNIPEHCWIEISMAVSMFAVILGFLFFNFKCCGCVSIYIALPCCVSTLEIWLCIVSSFDSTARWVVSICCCRVSILAITGTLFDDSDVFSIIKIKND